MSTVKKNPLEHFSMAYTVDAFVFLTHSSLDFGHMSY